MTTIKIGDTLNKAGSTLLMDGTTLFGQQFVAPNGPVGTINEATKWQPGYESVWSTNADGTGELNISAINIGSELEVFLTLTGQKNLGIPYPITASPSGLTITPRMMTAAERAKVNTRPELSSQTWLSFAAVTADALAAPAYFEIECTLPPGPGSWPAWWFLRPGQWPPEIDCFELFNAAMTTSLHSTVAWTAPPGTSYVDMSGPDFKATEYILQSGFDVTRPHRYGTLFLADVIATFVDDVCVWEWPTPGDLVNVPVYALIDFAVGAPGSGPGTPTGNSVGSMVISDIQILRMPANYVSGTGTSTPTPVPVPTPTPVPTPMPTPTPTAAPVTTSPSGTAIKPGSGTIIDSLGHAWTVAANDTAMRNGVAMSGTNITGLVYSGGSVFETNGTLWWQWSDAGNTWLGPVASPLASPLPTPTPTPVPTPSPTPTPTPPPTTITLAPAQLTALRSEAAAIGTALATLQATLAAL